VPSGRLHQDGTVIVSDHDNGLRLRRKMAYAGHISIGLVIDLKGKIMSGPEMRLTGLPEGKNGQHLDHLMDGIEEAVETVLHHMRPKEMKDEDMVEDKISGKVKRYVKQATGKRTIVDVIVHRI